MLLPHLLVPYFGTWKLLPLTVGDFFPESHDTCPFLVNTSLIKTTMYRTNPQFFRIRVGGQRSKIHRSIALPSPELSHWVSREQQTAMKPCPWSPVNLMELGQGHNYARPWWWWHLSFKDLGWLLGCLQLAVGNNTPSAFITKLETQSFGHFITFIKVFFCFLFFFNLWKLSQTLLSSFLLASSCPVYFSS